MGWEGDNLCRTEHIVLVWQSCAYLQVAKSSEWAFIMHVCTWHSIYPF